MKSIIFKTMTLLLFLTSFLIHGNAQNVTLVVTTTDGAEQTFELTNDGRLYFENGEQLIIEDCTGATTTFQLGNIQKLICTEVTGVVEGTVSDLQLIPNPTRNSFFIQNLQGSCQANIYTLEGRLVKSFEAKESQPVDISDLAPGMYFLHIDGQTLKMMKL